MAETLFNLGRDQEALDTLHRMVNRSADPYAALPLAAETAFRYKKFAEAAQYRSRLAGINPEAMENRIELARTQFATGESRAAVDTLTAVLTDRKTPSELVAQASFVMFEWFDSRRDEARQALTHLPANAPRVAPARAFLLWLAGEEDQSYQLVASMLQDRYDVLARILNVLAQTETGTEATQIKAIEEALYLDPEQVIARHITFFISLPRYALVEAYHNAERHEAALQIVQSDYEVKAVMESVPPDNESAPTPAPIPPTPDDELMTMEQRNAAGKIQRRIEVLPHMAQAAKALGDYERAVGYLRARLALLRDESEINATKQTIAEVQAEAEQQSRLAVQRMVITKNEVHLGTRAG